MKNSDKPIHPLQDLGFPSDESVIESNTLHGLTKREYFAIQALKGSMAFPNVVLSSKERCQWAINIADELLNELEK